MRTFALARVLEDGREVRLAQGVEFDDGTVAVRWTSTSTPSIAFFEALEDFEWRYARHEDTNLVFDPGQETVVGTVN